MEDPTGSDSAVTESAAPAPKRRGRKPVARPRPQGAPEALEPDLVIHRIPLSEIDPVDQTFRFRAVVRVPDLLRSLSEFGQQIPAVVRPHARADAGFKYQLISGFRRMAALQELGAATLSAYVRRDLDDDQAAFRASVLENIARKTYTDIDRAYIIRRTQESGYQSFEVSGLMGLSKRQKNNLLSLLDLPAEVQAVLSQEDRAFTTTHALTFRKLKQRHRGLNWAEWIGRVESDGLSIPQMSRAVNASAKRRVERTAMASIFLDGGMDTEKGLFRLRPLKIDVSTLTPAEKRKLRAELEGVLRHVAEG